MSGNRMAKPNVAVRRQVYLEVINFDGLFVRHGILNIRPETLMHLDLRKTLISFNRHRLAQMLWRCCGYVLFVVAVQTL